MPVGEVPTFTRDAVPAIKDFPGARALATAEGSVVALSLIHIYVYKRQRHEFRLRVVDPGHTDPFVILTPQRRVDRLLVRVKFPLRHGDAAPPPAVERLDGILARFVTDQTLRGTPVEVDAVGEVAEEFRGLRAGFSYGVRWRAGSTQA